MKAKALELVVAADEARGIGKDGKLPWRLREELLYFKRLTSTASPGKENAVLMGRKTYESIAPKFRPLAGRRNLVLSRSPSFAADGAERVGSLDEALARVADDPSIEHVFVIGGGELYRQALAHPACARVYLTRVHARFDCDTTLPAFEADYVLVHRDGPQHEGALSYDYEVWERAR